MVVFEKQALMPKMAGAAPRRAKTQPCRHGPQGEDRERPAEVGEDEPPLRMRWELRLRHRAQQEDGDREVEGEQGQAAGRSLVERAQSGGEPSRHDDAEDRRDDLDEYGDGARSESLPTIDCGKCGPEWGPPLGAGHR